MAVRVVERRAYRSQINDANMFLRLAGESALPSFAPGPRQWAMSGRDDRRRVTVVVASLLRRPADRDDRTTV